MLAVTLILNMGDEEWSKKVVIYRPHKGEIIDDSGLRFGVVRIAHCTTGAPGIIATVEGEVRGNTHWELGHERGWTLKQ
jgi:hypothetical protein